MSRPRNTNRRLGDRLWDEQGQEWNRVRTTRYHLLPDELATVLAAAAVPRVALQADHAPLRWPAPAQAKAVLEGSETSFPGNGNGWAATLWRPATGPTAQLLLMEEVH